MKNSAAILLLICVVLGLGAFMGLIGFHYPRVIENQPLSNPIAISNVEGLAVSLTDGRILELESYDYNGSENHLLAKGTMIEIEEISDGEVVIWGNKPGWICGTPWAQPIRIPLLADDVYRNRREMLSFATYAETKAKAEQGVAPQSATRSESESQGSDKP